MSNEKTEWLSDWLVSGLKGFNIGSSMRSKVMTLLPMEDITMSEQITMRGFMNSFNLFIEDDNAL